MRTIEYENPWFQVIREGRYYFVQEPKAQNAAAVLMQSVIPGPTLGKFILVEQTRPASGGRCLEIVRGYGEPGEDSAMCARREALEETGYELDRGSLRHLGAVRPNSAILAGPVDLYYGQARRRAGRPDDEIDCCILLDERDLKSKIVSGEILDGFTLSAYLLWTLKDGCSSDG
ncbi:MAG: NUDIX hydrolase [Gammaproteobacteria bacterium]|nr:NUDIX hydrolase [Gammaproteobacteria bacterium]